MMTFLAILVGILILLFLITLHEFGHFVMAKIFKVYVYEFSIGIGPKIFSWKGKETVYSIRLLPFGGYVFVASEYIDPPKSQKDIEIQDNRFIESVNRGKRLLIVLSGIFMNLLIAALLFTSIFAIAGYSSSDMNGYGANYITEINSPSHILNLDKNNNKKNPIILTDISFIHTDLSFLNSSKNIDLIEQNGISLNSIGNLHDFYDTAMKLQKILIVNDKNKDNTIFVKYGYYDYKNKSIINITKDWSNAYRYDDKSQYKVDDHYIIGMSAPNYYFTSRIQAYEYGWKKTFEDSKLILQSFGKLFTGHWAGISGPIGTIEQTKSYINSGWENFFVYVAIISANLFVLNLIPIPPLDGFKFLTIFIEMCIRRELNQKVKIFVSMIGVTLFLILFICLTVKDLL